MALTEAYLALPWERQGNMTLERAGGVARPLR